jgi:hypothetical protein
MTEEEVKRYLKDRGYRRAVREGRCDNEVKELASRFRKMFTATHFKHWHTERNSTYDFWNDGYLKNAT